MVKLYVIDNDSKNIHYEEVLHSDEDTGLLLMRRYVGDGVYKNEWFHPNDVFTGFSQANDALKKREINNGNEKTS